MIVKRSEFANIVNGVYQAELKRMADEIPQKLKECDQQNTTAELFAFVLMNSAEIASRITAEIISKAGVLEFDPEDPA